MQRTLKTILPMLALLLALSSLALAQGKPAEEKVKPEGKQDMITLVGVLTDEGVECQALRARGNQLFTLTGDLGGFQVGDRVRVVGSVAEVSTCQQGTTVVVRSIQRVGRDQE
jgi:hypothetical protein